MDYSDRTMRDGDIFVIAKALHDRLRYGHGAKAFDRLERMIPR